MRSSIFLIATTVVALFLAGCATLERMEQPPTGEAASPPPTPTLAPEIEDQDAPPPEPTPEPTPEPPPEPESAFAGAEWLERGRLNVLLAGTDPAFYHAGSRTDVMMVASIDLESGYIALFGIPRSLGEIPLREDVAEILLYDVYAGQINALYRIGERNPDLFPDARDPGMFVLQAGVEELLGIPIDYYAVVNMQGFVAMVDAFGGVEVNVREPVHVRLMSPEEGVGWQEFNIQPGEQTLDGGHALAYARSRSGSDDYDRMERQRCIVASAIDQADLTTLLQRFPEMVDAFRQHVGTNIPIEQLPDLIMLRDQIQADRIITIGFNPPRYTDGQTSEGDQRPNYQVIRDTVQHVMAEPEHYLDGQGTELLDDQHC